MTTNSYIIVQRTRGTWAQIYCSTDGHLHHTGGLLERHYNTQELAEAVVAPGDMWYLDTRCNKPDGHSFDHPVNGYSVYFGRDRGDLNSEPHIGASLAAVWPRGIVGCELAYVWKIDGGWHVGNVASGPHGLHSLHLALADVPFKV